MKTNAAALALIKEFEGFSPVWYPDAAHGWKVPTLGYGHTDAAGAPRYKNNPDLRLTVEEGTEILARDLTRYEADVSRLVKVPLNENQFGALVSFIYNLGAGNLGSSTLLRKLNAGDYAGAAGEFPKWVKANGQTLNGLVRRRQAEQALFRRPVSSRGHVAKPTSGIVAIIVAVLKAVFGSRK